jgi:hypothetical protein
MGPQRRPARSISTRHLLKTSTHSFDQAPSSSLGGPYPWGCVMVAGSSEACDIKVPPWPSAPGHIEALWGAWCWLNPFYHFCATVAESEVLMRSGTLGSGLSVSGTLCSLSLPPGSARSPQTPLLPITLAWEDTDQSVCWGDFLSSYTLLHLQKSRRLSQKPPQSLPL